MTKKTDSYRIKAARNDAWADCCDAPVERVQTALEGEIGECEPPDPREVTSRWPDDMTRH